MCRCLVRCNLRTCTVTSSQFLPPSPPSTVEEKTFSGRIPPRRKSSVTGGLPKFGVRGGVGGGEGGAVF